MAGAATKVRHNRSTDATITTSDTEVGAENMNTLFNPENYGACVDSVPRESDTTNNCSTLSARLEMNQSRLRNSGVQGLDSKNIMLECLGDRSGGHKVERRRADAAAPS